MGSESARLFDCDAFEDVRSLREAATKIIDVVEARLRTESGRPLAEILASLKCLKNAGRDCTSILQAWSHQGAASLKEWIQLTNGARSLRSEPKYRCSCGLAGCTTIILLKLV